MDPRIEQEATLRRLARVKRTDTPQTPLLGPDLLAFFKQVEKHHRKFGKLSEAWEQLIPELLQEHCCLESYARGTLTVLVDSSSHLYDLKQLLLAGLEKQLLLACKSQSLRKVALKAGRWYDGDGDDRRLRFNL